MNRPTSTATELEQNGTEKKHSILGPRLDLASSTIMPGLQSQPQTLEQVQNAVSDPSRAAAFKKANEGLDYDVLIVGAGLSGIYSLHKMRDQLGLRAKALEAGSGEGGTWFWNRYPGARFDSESWSYGFSFSQEVLDEWAWSEHFAGQPEILRYANFLTEKFDLRRDMIFNTQVVSSQFQEAGDYWVLTDQNGKKYTCRYLVTAMGILNAPTPPNIPGVNDFKNSWHTSRWPSDDSALKGKNVGIIGTGATGIQVIQSIAGDVGSLKIFQRTPNWAAPLRNSPISDEEMADIRKRYPEIFKLCMESSAGFVHASTSGNTLEMDPDERNALWEALYAKPGFAKFLGVNTDIFVNKDANALYSAFMAEKIRQRVHDPVVAEKLIPKCHGFGTRRLPLESGYFDVFNQPNVTLVDIKEAPIERITENGVQTTEAFHELDILIYATGFDATTGSFRAVDIRGRGGQSLTDVWSDGIRTQLGLTVKDFPNFLMIMGPHQAFGNFPRSIEYAVNWVADYMQFARDNVITCMEATEKGTEEWTQHVHDCSKGLLSQEVDSWMTGVNKNLAYKQKRTVFRYNGPGHGYRRKCDEVKARNYSDFKLKKSDVALEA